MKRKTPEEVVREIFFDNEKFARAKGREFFEAHIEAQSPVITLVTCSDSRVHPTVFSEKLIDRVFVIRNIGNQIESSAGSVDYGVIHLQTPVLLILGHVNCGAVKAFLKGYADESPFIRNELNHLCIPVSPFKGEGNFEVAWREAVESNVHWQVRVALERYGLLIRRNRLAVIGAIYDFANYYGRGFGRIVVVNVNGIREREALLKHRALSLLPEELRREVVV
ncbi:carbonic anhydrase [Thermovibrio ammonificans HB-1]|uniref:carbonic anhydrase n=1 Tax=Thermovibrio ammonificans (strain DSM 15698 / JCM 12110 / HB-1) TaxID=648996 RepID=E8T340_THEA1|nr:carbonic anhydrase [Thermovibrio ammonificans]ADU96045.1 carbonic anhydrase [Thermovibrio ammonificans HB-1]